jgi:hypothetical protein
MTSQLDLFCKRAIPGRSGVVSTKRGVLMTCQTPTNAAGDADPERAAPNIMDATPENQAPTFRNQDQIWPVRVIRRGDAGDGVGCKKKGIHNVAKQNTNPNYVSASQGDGALKFEVTDAMIAAGSRVIAESYCVIGNDVAPDLARDVFIAMWDQKDRGTN